MLYKLKYQRVIIIQQTLIKSIVAVHQTQIKKESFDVLDKVVNSRHESKKETEEHKTDTSTKKRIVSKIPPINPHAVGGKAEDESELTPVNPK